MLSQSQRMWRNAAAAVQHLSFGIAMLVLCSTGSDWVIGGGTEEGSGPLSVTRALSSACPLGNMGDIRTSCHTDDFRRSWVLPTHPHPTGFAGLHKAAKTAVSNLGILKEKEHFKVKKDKKHVLLSFLHSFKTCLGKIWGKREPPYLQRAVFHSVSEYLQICRTVC